MEQVYTKPGMDLSKYSKVMVDEVQFYLKKDAAEHGLQASELKDFQHRLEILTFLIVGYTYVSSYRDRDVLNLMKF